MTHTRKKYRKRLHTAEEIVDAIGGTAATALLTERKMQHVSNWKASGRLPPDTFMIVKKELERRGFTASPTLFGISPA
jgi:hypothetical protein